MGIISHWAEMLLEVELRVKYAVCCIGILEEFTLYFFMLTFKFTLSPFFQFLVPKKKIMALIFTLFFFRKKFLSCIYDNINTANSLITHKGVAQNNQVETSFFMGCYVGC